jgi:hypothetical protein
VTVTTQTQLWRDQIWLTCAHVGAVFFFVGAPVHMTTLGTFTCMRCLTAQVVVVLRSAGWVAGSNPGPCNATQRGGAVFWQKWCMPLAVHALHGLSVHAIKASQATGLCFRHPL